MTFSQEFLRHLRGAKADDRLEVALGDAVRRARRAHPGIAVPVEDLLAHLAARVGDTRPLSEAVEALRADDLYLALGCARAVPAAIAVLEKKWLPGLRAEMARVAGADADEALQLVRQILLLPSRGGRPPAIGDYSGRADLRSWLKIIGVREAQRLAKKAPRERRDPDEAMADAIAPADDPEVAYMRSSYRQQFARAFRHAVGTLDPRERTVLRQHLIDGLSIDGLASLYDVHRATAARWLARAREQVLQTTRAELRRQLGLSPSDLASAMRLIESRLDISFRTLLRSSRG
jgi:RNA polymerase sigma-70 factor, ECF subfamily